MLQSEVCEGIKVITHHSECKWIACECQCHQKQIFNKKTDRWEGPMMYYHGNDEWITEKELYYSKLSW